MEPEHFIELNMQIAVIGVNFFTVALSLLIGDNCYQVEPHGPWTSCLFSS